MHKGGMEMRGGDVEGEERGVWQNEAVGPERLDKTNGAGAAGEKKENTGGNRFPFPIPTD